MDVYIDSIENNEEKKFKTTSSSGVNGDKELSGKQLSSSQNEQNSAPAQSRRASMRRFANAACHSNSFARAPALGSSNPTLGASPNPSTLPSKDTLPDIEGRLELWKAEHPGVLSSQIEAIESAITALEKTAAQNNGPALRKYIEENPLAREIFDPKVTAGIPDSTIQSLYKALNVSRATPTPSLKPPITPGFVPVILDGLKPGQTITVTANGLNAKTYTQKDMMTFQGPEGKTHYYINIPSGYPGGRITLNNGSDSSTFVEFTTNSNGTINLNFTGVDGIPSETATIQAGLNPYNPNTSTVVTGIEQDRATFVKNLQALYGGYGSIGQEWLSKTDWNATTIPSGKNMTGTGIYADDGNPQHMGTCVQQLLTNLEGKTLYITSDFHGRIEKKYNPAMGAMDWAFVPDSGCTQGTVFFPPVTSPQGILAGADGGLGVGKWNYADNENACYVAHAIAGIVNNGMVAADVLKTQSAQNPLANKPTEDPNNPCYFEQLGNVQNFYKAKFYNVFLRGMHEAGANGYGVDYDEEYGGSGGECGAYATITFNGGTSPTPPPSNLDKIKKEAQQDYDNAYKQYTDAQKADNQARANYQQVLNAYNHYSGSNKAQVKADLDKAARELNEAETNLNTIKKGDLAKAHAALEKVLADTSVTAAQQDLKILQGDDKTLTSDITTDQIIADITQAQKLINAANALMKSDIDKIKKEAQQDYDNAYKQYTDAQKADNQARANYQQALNTYKHYSGPNKAQAKKDLDEAVRELNEAETNLNTIKKGDLAKAHAALEKVLADTSVTAAQQDLKILQGDDKTLTSDITADQIIADITQAQKQIDAANKLMKPTPSAGLDKLIKETDLEGLFEAEVNELRQMTKGSFPYNVRVKGKDALHRLAYISKINSLLNDPIQGPKVISYMKSQGYPINDTGVGKLADALIQDEIKHASS